MRLEIEIDLSDYLDGEDVAKSVMADALDMLSSGRADTAASILSNALGCKIPGLETDTEQDRKNKLTSLFEEWQSVDKKERGAFWEWSHGRRLCS